MSSRNRIHRALMIEELEPRVAPAILYVDVDATGLSDGTSWTDAYNDLQDALTSAVASDEIWVAAGTYSPGSLRSDSFQLVTGVGLYGGFAGDETIRDDRDWQANVTILSGDIDEDDIGFTNNDENVYHVVAGADGGLIDGFTITGGNANGTLPVEKQGGGLYQAATALMVSNCVFQYNTAEDKGGAVYAETATALLVSDCTFMYNTATDGGGMALVDSGLPTVTSCQFADNTASGSGGGMYNDNSSPILTDCGFGENTAGSYGGGIYNTNSSSADLINCTLGGNTAEYGGGIANDSSSPTLTNCVVGANTASQQGGGIWNNNSSPVLMNCTLSGNTSDLGGGMYNASSSAPTLTNCILWGDSAVTSGNEIYNDTSAPNISYSDIEGSNGSGGSWDASLGNDMGNNIDDDPLLVNDSDPVGPSVFSSVDDGVRLNAGSPVLNAGTSAGAPAVDISGVARPQAGGHDMGAHEFVGILYVDTNATGANNGTSWTNAYPDLQSALAVATLGQDIWVADGTYLPTTGSDREATFQLVPGVGVYGGFKGVETLREERDWDLYPTILSGDLLGDDGPDFLNNDENVFHVVTGADDSVLDGFTVTGGNANDDRFGQSDALTYASADTAIAIASGDLNNDTKLDLVATVTGGADHVYILMNTGDVGGEMEFTAGGTYAVGDDPVDIALADLDHDTDLDIATANRGSGNISILLGNGDGTFAGAVNIATGAGASGVAIGDINGDTHIDIVVVNSTAGTLSVLLGNGDGTFSAPTDTTLGVGCEKIVLANLNGDTNLDAVVVNRDNDWIHVLLGNGDGTFQSPVSYAVGAQPCAVVTADFDADTDVDIAVANYGSDNVSVLKNNGDGTFGTATNYDVEDGPTSIAVGDLYANTWLDLIVTNRVAGTMSVLSGGSGGTFSAHKPRDYASSAGPEDLIFVDLNGDETLDIATVSSGPGFVGVSVHVGNAYENNGWGTVCGGGMYNEDASPTVANCTFTTNSSVRDGGGMYNHFYSSPSVSYCTFTSNRSEYYSGGGMYNNWYSTASVMGSVFSQNVVTNGSGGGMYNNYSQVTLVECTFSNNTAGKYAGALVCSRSGNVRLTDCTFNDNTASWGGAMYNVYSSPTLTNCAFSGNEASSSGAMCNVHASPTVSGSTFTSNSAVVDNGGAISGSGSSFITLTDCAFSANESCKYGGAIVAGGSSQVEILGCSFTGNTAVNYNGGGICYWSSRPLELKDCTFTGNSAAQYGGGVWSENSTDVMLDGCLFRGNSAQGGSGGGIGSKGSLVTSTNSTFTDNTASIAGGGAYAYTGSLTATNCTFSNNTVTTYSAGGLYCSNISLTLTECSFIGNTALAYAGALECTGSSSTLSVTRCEFSGNGASWGGAVYNIYSSPVFSDCVFSRNESIQGGAMYNVHASPTIAGCTFLENRSTQSGGAIASSASSLAITESLFVQNESDYGGAVNAWQSSLSLTDCTLKSNRAEFHAGGIYGGGSSTIVVLANCSFTDNRTATYEGGAIYILQTTSATLSNCIFTNNIARRSAGAVYCNATGLTLTNCVLADNTAETGSGGGIWTYNTALMLTNCMVWGNAAAVSSYHEICGTAVFNNCDIQGCGGSGAGWNPSFGTDGGGNIDADPLFTDVLDPDGADDEFGTIDDGLRVCPGSPVINAGTDLGAPATDIVGLARPAGQVDMGAYEFVGVAYVDKDAAGLNNGTSWTDAYTDLGLALAGAAYGSEIWVAEGVYVPSGAGRSSTYQLASGVAVFAGFSGVEATRGERDRLLHPTILSGDVNGDDVGFTNNVENIYHVVTGADAAQLDGFRIMGGNADGGVSPDDCGGGVYSEGTSPVLTHCLLEWNSGTYGGAIGNRLGASPLVKYCILRDNAATYGGAMYSNASSPTAINTLFLSNSAAYGGAISDESGASEVTNCTLYGNTADYGGCIYYANASTGLLRNSIVWGNTATTSGDGVYTDSSTPTLEYSDIQGSGGSGGTWNTSLGLDGGGNVDADPLFAAAADPDGADDIFGTDDDGLTFPAESPAKDSGTFLGAPLTDLVGTRRPICFAPDMGAYENLEDWAEQNDSLATAWDFGALSGVNDYELLSMDATAYEPIKEDWFRFEMQEDGLPENKVSISFYHPDGDLDVYLYNELGALLSSSATVSNTETISLDPYSAGVYYVLVKGNNGATNPDYTLTIDVPIPPGIPEDWAEENDDLAEAYDLGQLEGRQTFADLTMDDTVNEPTPTDWFVFETLTDGVSGNSVSIAFRQTEGDLDLYLYDSLGRVLSSSIGVTDNETVSLSGLIAGSYYVEVRGRSGATNPDYTLSFNAPVSGNIAEDWAEPNDAAVSAYDLVQLAGTSVFTELTMDDSASEAVKEDWFKFETLGASVTGHYVRIDFVDSQGDLDLRVYDGTLTLVGGSYSTGDRETVSLAGLAAGIYYVEVFGYNGDTNPDYTLTIAAPAEPGSDWAEPNDDLLSAYDLRTIEGSWSSEQVDPLSIHETGNDDWFKFETVGGGASGNRVSLHFENAQGNLDLELYDSIGTLLGQSAGVGNNETISLSGLAAGIYYARVIGSGGATNPNYTLEVDAPRLDTGTWTILVYLDGDDESLDGTWSAETYALSKVNEIESVVLPAHIQVGILLDRIAGFDASNGDWTDTRVGIAAHDEDPNTISTVFTVLDASAAELNLGDPETLTKFIEWGAAALPADHYALFLFDHGDGYRGACWDTTNGHDRLTLRQIGQGISESGEYMDVVAFEACMMQMVEVGYEIRTQAGVMVGSEDVIYAPGWDWEELLSWAGSQAGLTAEGFGSGLVSSQQSSQPTLSAVCADEFTLLSDAIRGFSEAVLSSATAADWGEIVKARGETTSYPRYESDYADLGMFMSKVAAGVATQAIKDAANAVLSVYNGMIVDSVAAVSGLGTGLSIYFPEVGEGVSAEYRSVSFGKASGWVDFLGAYVECPYGSATGVPWSDVSNYRSTAYRLGVLTAHSLSYEGLAIEGSDDEDWFQFEMVEAGDGDDDLSITFENDDGDLDLYIYDENGDLVDWSETQDDVERVSLTGYLPGRYFVMIVGEDGATNDYWMEINAPGTGQTDWSEPNDTLNKAYDLGGPRVTPWVGLTLIPGDSDWFGFNTSLVRDSYLTIRVTTLEGGGEVTVNLYDALGGLLGWSSGAGEVELGYVGSEGRSYILEVTGVPDGDYLGYQMSVMDMQPLGPEPSVGFAGMTVTYVDGDGDILEFVLTGPGTLAVFDVEDRGPSGTDAAQVVLYDTTLASKLLIRDGREGPHTICLGDLICDGPLGSIQVSTAGGVVEYTDVWIRGDLTMLSLVSNVLDVDVSVEGELGKAALKGVGTDCDWHVTGTVGTIQWFGEFIGGTVYIEQGLGTLQAKGRVAGSEIYIVGDAKALRFLQALDNTSVATDGVAARVQLRGGLTNASSLTIGGKATLVQLLKGQTNSEIHLDGGAEKVMLYGGLDGTTVEIGADPDGLMGLLSIKGDLRNGIAGLFGGSSVTVVGDVQKVMIKNGLTDGSWVELDGDVLKSFMVTGGIASDPVDPLVRAVHVTGTTNVFKVQGGISGGSAVNLDGDVQQVKVQGDEGEPSVESGSRVWVGGALAKSVTLQGSLAGDVWIMGSAESSTMKVTGDLSGKLVALLFGDVLITGAFSGEIGNDFAISGLLPTTLPRVGNTLTVKLPGGPGQLYPGDNIFGTRIGYG